MTVTLRKLKKTKAFLMATRGILAIKQAKIEHV